MDLEAVLAILIGGLIVLVPVAGITARLALKPLIEPLIRLAEARRSTQEVHLLERRVALLEQELGSLRADVQEIGSQGEFYRKLAEPPQP